MEAEKAELEIQIEKERLVKPKISAEFMTFWLHRFRKLDVTQKSHRQMLIDTFVNAIYVYDDKLLLTYNFKEETDTISLADVKNAAKGKNGSDLDCCGAPKKRGFTRVGGASLLVYSAVDSAGMTPYSSAATGSA